MRRAQLETGHSSIAMGPIFSGARAEANDHGNVDIGPGRWEAQT